MTAHQNPQKVLVDLDNGMETRNPGDEDKNNPRNRIVNERKPLEGEGKIRL